MRKRTRAVAAEEPAVPLSIPRAAAKRSIGPPLSEGERWAWVGLIVLSLALRLFALDARPFHHDESIHSWFAYHLITDGEYKYDPVYHGPVQYAMVALAFKLLGDSDFTARLPAALGGVVLVALALLLRPRFGRGAAFAAGALLAISPNFLYYTRFCREDVWSLLGTAGTFLFFDSWFRTRRLRDLALAAVAAAVAFAAKENFYVLVALMVPSVVAFCLEPDRGIDPWNRLRRLIDFLEENSVALAGAILLFFVVSELLYTVLLIHPESGNPAFEAISYWYGQHKVERVGGPKTYHIPRMLQYEFAILIPAFAWLISRWRRLTGAERFLAGWGISSVLMYAYLGEKTPWLIVHQLLPFVPLAACAWVTVVEAVPSSRTTALRGLGLAAALASVVSAISLSFWYPALTPRVQKAESVIYVQTAPELLPVVEEIKRYAAKGTDLAAAVDGEAAWPLSWYLRHLPVQWSIPNDGRKPPIVFVDEGKVVEAMAILGPDYVQDVIPLRAWWVPETSWKPLHPTPRELLVYLFTRKPWSVIGSQQVIVLRRRDVAQAPP